ncbi:heterokaryon incompatibility protein-domain-containing protein [Parachaetomium inaequale]|uniref:Heterokaryon incompatibility protein-domain-containing protein n=1 Tax=Parachaetomium inaequale TaxID=2588326 RepID=A0AAN6P7U4_9PEZI|nr:heterokaryon incompatibility protein-domain-containing protein [Parachaetomium inaequale]
MTRWHKPDCTAPDIVVANPPGPPSCKTCGSTPNLDEIIHQQAHESPFPAPPPDEPQGQMNLWWPRSVPYLNTHNPLPGPTQPDSASSPSNAPPHPTPEIPVHVPSRQHETGRSPIYPTRLKTGEIRLACFQAPPSSSPDDPVHLTLETYPLSNCPPYETVSYCWAGEDGDDRRCCPVYVGPYWDVILHTRNCWKLLRFVRPARGVRLVWVDAVCIDQGCDDERAAQVAQMGRIYTLCTQVIVYLGPDLAPLLPDGELRELRKWDWDGVKGARGVKKLLQKRYFSRLWVVQELILSPRVVIRIGDVDFQSDGATSGSLWSAEAEGLAPWARHASRGAPLDLDFLQVMQLTLSSDCADPRDRIFGVMGIISDESRRLEPDYSLSLLHVFVGLFAHLLIVKGMRRLLALASGVSGPASVPSWVPDWTSWDRWQAVFAPREVQSASDLYRKTQDLRALMTDRGPRGHNLVSVHLSLRYRRAGSLFRSSAFGIDPTTAALRAKMIRLLGLGSMPKFVGQLGQDSLMLFETPCGNHGIYLASRHRLDMLVEPGNDDLYFFALEEDSRAPGLCILRRFAGSGGNSVRLIATCEELLFCFAAGSADAGWPATSSSFAFERFFLRWDCDWSTQQLDDIDTQPPMIGDLYWTLSEVIEWAHAWLDATLNPDEQLLFLPQFNAKRRDILPVYLALLQKHADDALDATNRFKGPDGVFNTYKQYVVENYGAELRQALFIFPVPFSAFNTLYLDKEHRRNRSQLDWEQAAEDPWSKFQSVQSPRAAETGSEISRHCPATATIAVQEETVRRTLLALSANRCFYMIRAAARRTGESVEQLLSRKTTDGDNLVRVPIDIWTERLMDEFGCDGSIEYVNIV